MERYIVKPYTVGEILVWCLVGAIQLTIGLLALAAILFVIKTLWLLV
jgi:hypothetical protein